MSLRFSETNVNPCCKGCNQFLGGNLKAYEYYLIKKYGEDIIRFLNSEKRREAKFSALEIECMTDSIKDQVRLLLKQKSC